jgi:hypothetical protein
LTRLLVVDGGNSRVLIYNNINDLSPTNGAADYVIGQPDMVSNSQNQGGSVGPNTLSSPVKAFFDGVRLFISDPENFRVLVYNSMPVSNNAPANEVIGQANLYSNVFPETVTSTTLAEPQGLWVDNNQNLYVVDSGNNRTLVYSNIDNLLTDNPTPVAVIGQSSYTSRTSGVSASQYANPFGVCVNNCQLFISDRGNSRVLVYNTIPTGTTNPPADEVLGQPNMTTGTLPSSPTAYNFQPYGIQAIGNSVLVADSLFNRVLEFSCDNSLVPAVKGKATGLLEGHSTPTVSPTQTPTFTPTPSPTVNPNVLVQSLVAAPNLVHDNQPIHFNLTLGHSALVHLCIYSLAGEKVFSESMSGSAGLNTLDWNLKNAAGQSVASGLFIYDFLVDDGQKSNQKIGKVIILR